MQSNGLVRGAGGEGGLRNHIRIVANPRRVISGRFANELLTLTLCPCIYRVNHVGLNNPIYLKLRRKQETTPQLWKNNSPGTMKCFTKMLTDCFPVEERNCPAARKYTGSSGTAGHT